VGETCEGGGAARKKGDNQQDNSKCKKGEGVRVVSGLASKEVIIGVTGNFPIKDEDGITTRRTEGHAEKEW